MEGTLAEIRMFAGTFAPRAWMMCQGQLLSISQWTAVFALVGTTYGGNGQTTFALPDFQGRFALGTGQGPGLPNIDLGEVAGVESTTLLTTSMPLHTHALTGAVNVQVNNDNSSLSDDATGKRFAATGQQFTASTSDLVNMANMSTYTLGNTGGSQPFPNRMPYLGMNYIFCVEGIFPSRN